MSYDLYFYKKEKEGPSLEVIENYLKLNLDSKNDGNARWYFENPDTEVHFWLDLQDSTKYTNPDNSNELLDGFENTNITFALNFVRPDFLGSEAFRFIDKFISDLGLFVFNPQSSQSSLNTSPGELFGNWSQLNFDHSVRFYQEFNLNYLPLDKSNKSWNYNYNRKILQKNLGDGYFVPRVTYFKPRTNNEVITVSTWANHIPNVFPPVDYYLIFKKYKKWFRVVEEVGFISSATFHEKFGSFLDNFDFEGCKIIHQDKASNAGKLFNSIRFEYHFNEFADRISINKIVNIKP